MGERRWPWTRLSLAAAIVGPALCIGGVPPWVVPGFCVGLLGLWGRWWWATPPPKKVRIPAVVVLPAIWAVCTALQCFPGLGLRPLLAAPVDAWVQEALQGTEVAPSTLSTSPADTGLEVARCISLAAIALIAAQFRWRWVAVCVAAAGTSVAFLGFVHALARAERIYGFYAAQHVARGDVAALMGPFVNPNHQSGLLLLGSFSAAGLACELRRRWALDARAAEFRRDAIPLAWGCVALQAVALLLSLSRAALVAALLLAPWAFVLARAGAKSTRGRDVGSMPAWLRVVIGVATVIVLLVVARHGALHELGTLFQWDAVATKFTTVRDALPMMGDAWVLGHGRGTFIDHFPQYERAPSGVTTTHLECVPLTLLVEWGVFVGGASVVAFVLWWICTMRWAGAQEDAVGRKILLLGLLALGLQSFADASLEFLGVAAPAMALVGASSLGAHRSVRAGPVVVGTLVALVFAAALGAALQGHTWSRREARNRGLEPGSRMEELAWRPLDARLHVRLGRAAAAQGLWSTATARARAATMLRPGLIDGWLLLAAAEHQAGRGVARDEAVARALARLDAPASAELVGFLVTLYPDAGALARLAPADERAWSSLVAGLQETSRAHADAVLETRARLEPTNVVPVLLRARLARVSGSPALALHSARLARQRAPQRADTHVEVANALMAFRPARRDEAIEVLAHALAAGTLETSRDWGVVEEQLVRLLAQRNGPGDRERIRELAPQLRRRTSTLAQRRVRERLLGEALRGGPATR